MARPYNRTVDTLLTLKTAGLIAASAAVATIVDLHQGASAGWYASQSGGDAVGQFEGDLVIDATAVEVGTGDELFTLILEGCNTSDFTTGSPQIEPLAVLFLGAGAVIPGAGSTSTPTGRYIVPWTNVKNNVAYRYVRMYTVVAGTIATGVNYTAQLAMRHPVAQAG